MLAVTLYLRHKEDLRNNTGEMDNLVNSVEHVEEVEKKLQDLGEGWAIIRVFTVLFCQNRYFTTTCTVKWNVELSRTGINFPGFFLGHKLQGRATISLYNDYPLPVGEGGGECNKFYPDSQ